MLDEFLRDFPAWQVRKINMGYGKREHTTPAITTEFADRTR